jgi:hypothetical protein
LRFGVYVAVYVVGAAGATKLWLRAPPSDQDANRYSWFDGACNWSADNDPLDPTIVVPCAGLFAVLFR